MAGMIGFLVWQLRHRRWVAVLFPAWFAIVLSPLLPLRNHIEDYYLTVPLLGLAMWGGWALVAGWRAGGAAGRIITISLVTVYLCVAVSVGRTAAVSYHDFGEETRRLVLGVVGLARNPPDRLVLLKGADLRMFWDIILHRPFRLFGLNQVYLVPEDKPNISANAAHWDISNFFAEPLQVRTALIENRAVVLDISGGQIRDITAAYRRNSLAAMVN